jgi:hypothetical protein
MQFVSAMEGEGLVHGAHTLGARHLGGPCSGSSSMRLLLSHTPIIQPAPPALTVPRNPAAAPLQTRPC